MSCDQSAPPPSDSSDGGGKKQIDDGKIKIGFLMESYDIARWSRDEKHFKDKPVEINTTMQECWGRDGVGEHGGWINDETARHLDADEAWYFLSKARGSGSNMLMNIGPRGDGSIHPADTAALVEVGRRIRQRGFPEQKPL